VVGPDAASVQMAREMLELFTETHELKPHQIDFLSHDYGMLSKYSTRTACAAIRSSCRYEGSMMKRSEYESPPLLVIFPYPPLSLSPPFPSPFLSLSLSVADIKTTSDAMVARVDRATNTLIIIGTSTAVRGVRLMLDTQVSEGEKEVVREGLEWREADNGGRARERVN
jgi:hypothetical protein